jgi:hypothetical protein
VLRVTDPAPTVPFSLLTLGVGDVERAAAFYVAAGFDRPPGPDGLVLLRTVGTVIALHPWDALARDAAVPSPGQSWAFRGVTMASNQASRAEVDAAYARWMAVGGTSVRPPRETSWGGYSGYVADLDGHLWELAHNPFLTFEPGGGFTLHA